MTLCNAKLNLYLKIMGKREDGYHLLNMINVPISLYDEMDISIERGEEGLVQNFSPSISCDLEKTTIYKAYKILKNFLPPSLLITVSIKKNIPEGSGMGGGSSNAAFFIKDIIQRFNIPLTERFLSEIANNVGADVPFFIFNRPAFLEGIGEKIYPYKTFPRLKFVVIKPDFSINTAWAYSLVKEIFPPDKNFKGDGIEFNELVHIMDNDLEKVVEEKYFEIKKIKNFLYNNNAFKAMMTGSGSAVFGIYREEDKLEEIILKAKTVFPAYKIFETSIIGA